MLLNKEDVLDGIITTVNEFKKMETKSRKVEVSVFEFGTPLLDLKTFVMIGDEFIGHFEGDPQKLRSNLTKVKHLGNTSIFYKAQLQTGKMPEDRFHLKNALYNDKLEDIKKFMRLMLLKNIDEEVCNKEFGGTAVITASHAKTEEELSNEKVKIYDKDPYTNSIAMSKDFMIDERLMIWTVTNILLESPSLIHSVYWNIYTDDKNNVNKYLHIKEDMFKAILENLPKSPNRETRITRRSKLHEYYNAFKNMREWFYSNGFDRKGLKDLMLRRTNGTKSILILVDNIMREIGVENTILKTTLFNNINFKAGIDSRSFGSDIKRDTVDKETQEFILKIEQAVLNIMQSMRNVSFHPYDIFGTVIYYLITTDLKEIIKRRPTKWISNMLSKDPDEITKIAEEYIIKDPYTRSTLRKI